jgi:hypothetical protein
MERQSVLKSESDKERPVSSSDFCVGATLPDSDRQRIYSTAWLPHIQGRDLAREVQEWR